MIEQLREIDKTRRLAATQPEPWHAVGSEVFDADHNHILKADSPARASYISSLHNQFLTTCTLLWRLCKKHVDRLNMTKEQNADNSN